jgi:hypothetical protein
MLFKKSADVVLGYSHDLTDTMDPQIAMRDPATNCARRDIEAPRDNGDRVKLQIAISMAAAG